MHEVFISSVAACLQLHFETSGSTQSRNYGRCGKIDFAFRIFFKLVLDICHHLFDCCIVAFFPFFQNDGQCASGLACADTRTGSGYVLHIFYGGILHQVADGAVGYDACAFECRAFRHFQLDGEIALVFRGKEAGRNQPVEHEDEYEHHAESCRDPFGVLDDSADSGNIFVVAQVQPSVDGPEYAVFRLVRILRLENQ